MGGSISISVGNLWAVIDIPCYFHENHDFLSGPKITQDVYGSPQISHRYRYTAPHTVIRTHSAFKIDRFLVRPVTHRLSPLISHFFMIGSLTIAIIFQFCMFQVLLLHHLREEPLIITDVFNLVQSIQLVDQLHGRGHNFCLQKSRMPLAGLVYLQ